MGSFDVNLMTGGKSSIDGVSGEDLDMIGMGFTLGYHIRHVVRPPRAGMTPVPRPTPMN